MTLIRNPKHIVIRKKGDVHEVAERKTPHKKQFEGSCKKTTAYIFLITDNKV
jgi:hypothetical protein